MPTACFQYKEGEDSLTSDKREQKIGSNSFREWASSPSQMASALCFHPILHFLLPSFCHQPSSAVHVQFRQFPRSLGSSRCCLAKTPVRFSAVAHLINLRSQFLTSNVSFAQSKFCPGLRDLEAQDSSQLERWSF